MLRNVMTLVLCTVVLAGCGRFSGWFSSSSARKAPESLAPKDGYPTAADDLRQLVPAISAARFEATNEGRMLIVTANMPVKGWWDLALITETPQPAGRYQPDADGVLRLRLVGHPPVSGSAAAGMPADPRVDSVPVALALSNIALAGVNRIEIIAAQNVISLRR